MENGLISHRQQTVSPRLLLLFNSAWNVDQITTIMQLEDDSLPHSGLSRFLLRYHGSSLLTQSVLILIGVGTRH